MKKRLTRRKSDVCDLEDQESEGEERSGEGRLIEDILR